MPEFHRGIVIENPYSSYARHPRRGDRIYRQLAESGLDLTLIPAHDTELVEGRLYDLKLGDGDVVISVGGDGTVHRYANLALSDTGDEIGFSKVPYIPIKGGNACDTSHMLNGNASLHEIITEGREIDVHAIEVIINGERFAHAIGYAGLNADAHATEVLDKMKHTFTPWERRMGKQLAKETLATLDAMANVDPIEVDRGDGEWQDFTQVGFYNGNRIAKLGRPHGSLGEPEFEELYINANTKHAVLGRMLLMGAGRLYGTMTREVDLTVRKKASAEQPGFVAMQIDGEVTHIPTGESGVRVQAKTAERTFRSISTRLPKRDN